MSQTTVVKTIILAATSIALATAASAQTLKPIKAEVIEFGETHGSAYYVPQADGYHLVATLATGNAQPVRFITVLSNGQSASVSVPGPVGGASEEVTFERNSEQLVVRQAHQASAAATQ